MKNGIFSLPRCCHSKNPDDGMMHRLELIKCLNDDRVSAVSVLQLRVLAAISRKSPLYQLGIKPQFIN
jgi:hypothetical protein